MSSATQTPINTDRCNTFLDVDAVIAFNKICGLKEAFFSIQYSLNGCVESLDSGGMVR